MAGNRTVLPNGTVQPQHGTPYETDLDANWVLVDQWQGGRHMADLGINGAAKGLDLSTSANLHPGVATGVLYAQGQRVPFTTPDPGAAPNNATNYLFYNSASGFYYQASAVGATTGDALLGKVTTSGGAVTAVVTATKIKGQVTFAASAPGNVTVQHYLGRKPVKATIRQTSGTPTWFQNPTDMDDTNLYLVAGGADATALVQIE